MLRADKIVLRTDLVGIAVASIPVGAQILIFRKHVRIRTRPKRHRAIVMNSRGTTKAGRIQMKLRFALIALAVLLALGFALSGCGGSSPTSSAVTAPAVRTVPADGASNISTSAAIAMAFDEPVDTMGFHQWFYCLDGASHDAMEDSLHRGGMGMGMGHTRDDTSAFYERMHERMIDGDFEWFGGGDSCEFHPATPFEPNTEFVMHFRHDMEDMHGEHMRHMGQMMTEDWTVRFHTGM